ncbi:hypothetical protein [Burkholderia gladioli]|uniref:hypothetical protein n=1 Tax=Burkholderia gladioli TaxID=28095 RepID=UPI00163E0171|nr:hypothetical protein [Burkholderia gladioli]
MTDEQNQQDQQLGNLNWTPDQLAAIQAGGASSLQINQITGAGGAAAGEGGSQPAMGPSGPIAGSATPQTAEQQESGVQATGTNEVPESGEDAASLVGSQSASGTSSSASPASLVAATPAEGASDVKSAIARLRDHLWTFEHSAVRHLHAELDKIESWFK